MHAWMEGRLSEDIVAEQRKVEEAELIIFQVSISNLFCLLKLCSDSIYHTGHLVLAKLKDRRDSSFFSSVVRIVHVKTLKYEPPMITLAL